MMRLDKKDLQVLDSAKFATDHDGTWRPWPGSYQRARNLAVNGYLKEAGTSSMPPHVVYVITPSGRTHVPVRPPLKVEE